MIRENESKCPNCGGELKHRDYVIRYFKSKAGLKSKARIERKICKQCGKLHRVLPDYLLPFKQYEKELIFGVREGLITDETLGYEDYPTELTKERWRSLNKQSIL